MSEMLGGGFVIFVIFAGVLAILWFLLPFAVFGVKAILERIAKQQEETNALLRELISDQWKETSSEPELTARRRD